MTSFSRASFSPGASASSGIDVAHLELLLLVGTQPQQVAVVDAPELRLAVIHHVVALAQVEVDDVHGV